MYSNCTISIFIISFIIPLSKILYSKTRIEIKLFKVDRLQIIVVAKNISTCPNCSSVGCPKCVQFHNWFRLH